jgi:thiamine biosynthesis protein ThiS
MPHPGNVKDTMESAETKLIEIVVNGNPRQVPQGKFLDRLLVFLEVDPSRVAVERNRQIARQSAWAATRIEPGDSLEIVWFVGGG